MERGTLPFICKWSTTIVGPCHVTGGYEEKCQLSKATTMRAKNSFFSIFWNNYH